MYYLKLNVDKGGSDNDKRTNIIKILSLHFCIRACKLFYITTFDIRLNKIIYDKGVYKMKTIYIVNNSKVNANIKKIRKLTNTK